MSYLRKAANQQRKFLIKKLIRAGVFERSDPSIYNKTITELTNEYNQTVKYEQKLIKK